MTKKEKIFYNATILKKEKTPFQKDLGRGFLTLPFIQKDKLKDTGCHICFVKVSENLLLGTFSLHRKVGFN